MNRAPRRFPDETLALLRVMPLEEACQRLGFFWKVDADFLPIKDSGTQRVYVSAGGAVFELLVTAIKWFDVRSARGGGGAIDLAMHLLGVDFVMAVHRLTAVTPSPGARKDSCGIG